MSDEEGVPGYVWAAVVIGIIFTIGISSKLYSASKVVGEYKWIGRYYLTNDYPPNIDFKNSDATQIRKQRDADMYSYKDSRMTVSKDGLLNVTMRITSNGGTTLNILKGRKPINQYGMDQELSASVGGKYTYDWKKYSRDTDGTGTNKEPLRMIVITKWFGTGKDLRPVWDEYYAIKTKEKQLYLDSKGNIYTQPGANPAHMIGGPDYNR